MPNPQNLNTFPKLMSSGIKPGDIVHVKLVGGITVDDAIFYGIWEDDWNPLLVVGIAVMVGGIGYKVKWSELLELWPIGG